MKRTREKQRRRAAAAVAHDGSNVDVAAHQRQASGGAPRFYTSAANEEEIDYYYQHLNNNVVDEGNEQHKSHRFQPGSAALRSKSESRNSHQKRRNKAKTVAGDDGKWLTFLFKNLNNL